MSEDVISAPVAPAPTAAEIKAALGPLVATAPAPAAPAPAVKPDAILIHRHYPRGKTGMDRHQALKVEFAPVLGTKLVWTRHCGSDESFLTGDSSRDHRYWPKHHANSGQEFYDWTDRGDGVLYGTLTPEAKAYLDEQSQA